MAVRGVRSEDVNLIPGEGRDFGEINCGARAAACRPPSFSSPLDVPFSFVLRRQHWNRGMDCSPQAFSVRPKFLASAFRQVYDQQKEVVAADRRVLAAETAHRI